MMDTDGLALCNSVENTVISSPRLDRQLAGSSGPDSFLIQVKHFETYDTRMFMQVNSSSY